MKLLFAEAFPKVESPLLLFLRSIPTKLVGPLDMTEFDAVESLPFRSSSTSKLFLYLSFELELSDALESILISLCDSEVNIKGLSVEFPCGFLEQLRSGSSTVRAIW